MRLRLDLAYDGTDFHGWADQPGLRTVQGELERAIATVLRLDEAVRVTCAGRTDTGVHARGQVAHVDVDADPAEVAHRLRRILPADVVLMNISEAPAGFDARFAALERRYVYRLHDGASGPDPLHRRHVVAHRGRLDERAMDAAGALLVGEHDFASFCRRREGATTIRTLLELSTRRDGDSLATTVRADAFCHSMVRALMGALVAVGSGKREQTWARDVLAAQVRDPAVRVMPAHGLVLEEVVYPAPDALAERVAAARQRRDGVE